LEQLSSTSCEDLQAVGDAISMYLRLLVEEHVNDEIPAFGVIEEDEQAPVNEPCALLQCLHCCRLALKHHNTYLYYYS
jgi:hypothetical protein